MPSGALDFTNIVALHATTTTYLCVYALIGMESREEKNIGLFSFRRLSNTEHKGYSTGAHALLYITIFSNGKSLNKLAKKKTVECQLSKTFISK